MKSLLSVLVLLTPWHFVKAQELLPDQLDYYLQQALIAEAAEQRLVLNHIGIQAQPVERGYLVSAVLETYPAQEAGLYRGDVIVSANGAPFHPVFSFNDRAMAPADFTALASAVELTVLRGDTELQLTVRPVFENLYDSYRSATISTAQQFPSGNKTVGYLRLWLLSRNSNDLISYRDLFAELAGTDGIILDVRDGAGFLDRDQLRLIYRGDSNPVTTLATADHNPITLSSDGYRNPVALLINGQTRGGAELFARQLAQLSRVITLGDQTAGLPGTWQTASAGEEDNQPVLRYVPIADDVTDSAETSLVPENSHPYPVSQPGRVDPQFQAAMDMLMGII